MAVYTHEQAMCDLILLLHGSGEEDNYTQEQIARDKLANYITHMENSVESVKMELEIYATENEELSKQVKALTAQLGESEDSLSSAEQRLADAREKMLSLETETGRLTSLLIWFRDNSDVFPPGVEIWTFAPIEREAKSEQSEGTTV